MRIGIDIRPLLEANPSGVSEYTFQIVKHLISIDQENKYLLFCNSWHPLSSKYLEIFKADNVSVVLPRVPNKIFNSLLFLSGLPKIDRRLGGVDVFFLPNLNFVSVSKKCPLVVTVHDLSFCQPGFNSVKSHWWHKFIKPKKTITQASSIIAVSQSTSQDLINFMHCQPDKIKVINPGVDFETYNQVLPSKLEEIKKKYQLDRQFILFLGTVEKRKNTLGLLEAWTKISLRSGGTCELVTAGNIKNKDLVKKFPTVKFLNYVPAEDKPALYHLASVFAYPSFYEGFGLPVIEAMAAGTPVIASNSTSIPEVTKGAALVVDPYNIEEMSRGLGEIIRNQTLRRDLISRGFQVAKDFNWQNSAKLTLEVIKQASNHQQI